MSAIGAIADLAIAQGATSCAASLKAKHDFFCGGNVDRLGYEASYVALLRLGATFAQMNSTFCFVLTIGRCEKTA
jgi:hypothetical protein